MRIDVLARITEACVAQGMPAPREVHMSGSVMTSLTLICDDDEPEHVDAWADFLGVPIRDDEQYDGERPWICHRARALDPDGGLWRGFQIVDVWCAVHPKAGA
jgi:hypothetical protein